MDGERVSRAWFGEFCRLKNKVCIDTNLAEKVASELPTWNPKEYK